MNLILTHGFLGFRHFFGINYFNGIKEYLEKTFDTLPLRVIVTEVEPLGEVQRRGKTQLRDQIEDAFNTRILDPDESTHLVAHSMGGLSARFCLSPKNPGNMADRITSLTTIGTPHRGSPIADLLTAGSLPFSSEIRSIFGLSSEEIDISLYGIDDLTTETASRFNQQTPDHPKVQYHSYAGRGRAGTKPTCALLLPTHALISKTTGEENDGLVTVTSASWGQLIGIWPADHADEIGHDLDSGVSAKPQAFDFLLEYKKIVEEIKEL
jgi:triacylglycerol lipase